MEKRFAIGAVIAIVIVAAIVLLIFSRPTPIDNELIRPPIQADPVFAEWKVYDNGDNEVGTFSFPLIQFDEAQACAAAEDAAGVVGISNFECFRIEDPGSSIMPGQWVVYTKQSLLPSGSDIVITTQIYIALDEENKTAKEGIIT